MEMVRKLEVLEGIGQIAVMDYASAGQYLSTEIRDYTKKHLKGYAEEPETPMSHSLFCYTLIDLLEKGLQIELGKWDPELVTRASKMMTNLKMEVLDKLFNVFKYRTSGYPGARDGMFLFSVGEMQREGLVLEWSGTPEEAFDIIVATEPEDILLNLE